MLRIKIFIFASLLQLLASSVYAINYAFENFDTYDSTYHTSGTIPSGFDSWYVEFGPASSSYNSVTHYSGEVSSGGHSGGGLKVWRADGLWGNFEGVLNNTALPMTNVTHWFMSYWIKLPIAFNCTESSFKLWRFNVSGAPGEMYFNFINGTGTMRTSGNLGYYDGNGWTNILTQAQTQALWDGNWHWMQFEFDTVNKVFKLDIDGNNKYSNPSFPYTISGYPTMIQHFPLGNTLSHAGAWQASWQALEVDDFSLDSTAKTYSGGSDTTAPVISAGSPSGALTAGTTSTTMSVTTDEAATCKYSTTAGVAYASMAGTFTTTGGTSHSVTVSGLSDGGSYSRYVRCSDSVPNVNASDYTVSWTVASPSAGITPGNVLFSESFSDNSWEARSWYDGTNSTGSTAGGYSGNGLKWTWASAATQPTGFSTIRAPFTARSEFMIEYWTKFETGWRGSGVGYHPHMIHVMSTDDAAYQSLNAPYNNLYFEAVSDTGSPYTIRPFFAAQDTLRVNTSSGTPPNNLVSTTETRSAFHCNTPYMLTSATAGGCDSLGGGQYYSVNIWKPPTASIPANTWTRMRYYIKRNTFTGGTANFDGIIRAWVGDTLVLEDTHMMYAANAYATTAWDKIIMAPWIGDGAPVTQSMWIDELKVYDGYTSGSLVSLGSVLLGK